MSESDLKAAVSDKDASVKAARRRGRVAWLVPLSTVGALFALWLVLNHNWDVYRFGAPFLIVIAVGGLVRVPRGSRWVFVPLAVTTLASAAGILVTARLGDVHLTWGRDGPLIVGLVGLGVTILLLRGFFGREAWLRELPDVLVLTVGVATVSLMLMHNAWDDHSSNALWLELPVAIANAFAIAATVSSVAVQTRWTMSSRMITGGLCVLLLSNQAYLLSNDHGVPLEIFWWVWMASCAGIAAGMLHPELDLRRDLVPSEFRLRFALWVMGLTLLSGAVTLLLSSRHVVLLVSGLVSATAVALRALLAVVMALKDRKQAQLALEREISVRDLERRELKRLVHDDVLQLLVVATWVAPEGEPLERIMTAERRTRGILTELQPVVPSLDELAGVLQGAAKKVSSDTKWEVQVALPAQFFAIRNLIWEVSREIIVACSMLTSGRALQLTITDDNGRCIVRASAAEPFDDERILDALREALVRTRSLVNKSGGALYQATGVAGHLVTAEIPLP